MQPESTRHTVKLFNIRTSQVSAHNVFIERGLHPANRNIVWSLKFEYQGGYLIIEGEYFLLEAMNKIRQIIEPDGFRVLIRGADYDAIQPGMLGDMTAGRKVYKVEKLNDRGKYFVYDIFDESDIASVRSLEEQIEFRRQFHSK